MITWKEAAEQLGWHISEDVAISTIGFDSKATEDIFYNHYGETFPYTKIRNLRIALAERRIEKDGLPVKEGATQILGKLEERGIKLALATSSTTKDAENYLEIAGLRNYFFVVVGGDQVQRGKPHPEIYLLVANLLNLDPNRCIVFEDSDVGLQAAYAAGIKVILIPDLKTPSPEVISKSYACFSSLTKARKDLDELLEIK